MKRRRKIKFFTMRSKGKRRRNPWRITARDLEGTSESTYKHYHVPGKAKNKAAVQAAFENAMPGWKVTDINWTSGGPGKGEIYKSVGFSTSHRALRAAKTRKKHRRSKARKAHKARKTHRRVRHLATTISRARRSRSIGSRHPKGTVTMSTKTRRRTRRSLNRIVKRRVGRKYKKASKGWMRITGGKRRKHAGPKWKHGAVRWSGRRGTVSFRGYGIRKGKRGIHRLRVTNPRRRRARRNPGMVGAYVGGLTRAPGSVMGLFRGKGMIKNVAFTGVGAVAMYMAGGMATKALSPLISKIPGADKLMANAMVQRVFGAIMPYTLAFVASQFLLKGKLAAYKGPVLLGGALASIVELVKPGMVGDLVSKIPGFSSLPPAVQAPAAGPVQGLAGYFGTDYALAGYVEASNYSGTGEQLAGYVEAQSYSGTGNDQLAGYVQSASYNGTAGYLDEAVDSTFKSYAE